MKLTLAPTDDWPESGVGTKARVLQQLINAGYTVPSLVVVPSTVLRGGNCCLPWCQEVAKEVVQTLGASSYAVRSAALIEDGDRSSQAGQFRTELAVSETELPAAVLAVITDAKAKTSLKQFSLIIQEYVEPDVAGVLFTRNPAGAPETIIEYVAGRNSSVVAGDSVERLVWLKNDSRGTYVPAWAQDLAAIGQEFEQLFAFAQDIEWVIQDSQLSIVQSRPLTTISEQQWQGIQALNTVSLPREYFFSQSALNENFDHPTPLNFSILESLYQPDGPVYSVYKTLGLRFLHYDVPQLILGAVYTDKVSELKTFLPAYTLRSATKKSWGSLHPIKILLTIWNVFQLVCISTSSAKRTKNTLITALNRDYSVYTSLHDFWMIFLKEYEVIYETSVRTERALRSFESMLPTHHKSLIATVGIPSIAEYVPSGADTWVGNSISIDDHSVFKVANATDAASASLLAHDAFPAWKRAVALQSLERYQSWQQNKELSRVLTVQLLQHLRLLIDAFATKLEVPDQLRSFLTIEELVRGTIDAQLLQERYDDHQANLKLTLPNQLYSSSVFSVTGSKSIGISAGEATGRLVTVDQLGQVQTAKILLVDTLSPNILQHFTSVEGIVSKTGGLLSHLAILAREHKLPVVVIPQVDDGWLGTDVTINGKTGEINKSYEYTSLCSTN